jgi:hypothetical protein
MVRRVTYNGVEMVEGWPERIIGAQTVREYVIKGIAYARVPYGAESDDWDAEHLACHDCRVVRGQLHVPSCDVEQCPACGDQAITCDCERDDESFE